MSFLARRFNTLIRFLDGAYFGVVAFTLGLGSIFGAVALMYMFRNDAPYWQIIPSIALVLGNNIIPVAQQRLKWIVILFLVSVSVNSLLILYHALTPGD